MKPDSLEQLRPKIDKAKCVNCKLCEKICPQNIEIKLNSPLKCFAAYSCNSDDLKFSASGGVAAVLGRYMLQNGATYGCDYDEHVNLNYFKLSDEHDVRKSQSSKYSQSDAYTIFNKLKQDLEQMEEVLFIGTPCQVAGLLQYLQKPYDNLITIDLICHGTPPTYLLKRHIKELGISDPISKIRFRGEYDQKLTIWKNSDIVYQKSKNEDVYFSAFYRNMISCESCYTCRYATSKRVSDITIGDFWGLGELNYIELKTGRPSIVLVNTNKGDAFFSKACAALVCEERTIKEGIEGNGRLNSPPGKNKAASYFQKFYRLGFGFKYSVYATNYVLLMQSKIKKFLKF